MANPRFVPRVLIALFVLLAFTNAFSATLEELRAAVQQNPNSVSAHVALGMYYYESGGHKAARDEFREAIALDYRVTAAHYGLGLAEFASGDYPGALFAFSEVIRLDPDRFDAYYNRAVTLSRLGQPLDAIAAYREALSHSEFGATNEDEYHANVGLARELSAVREYQAAADALGAALDIDNRDVELQLRRAHLLVQAGNGLDALPYLSDIEGEANDYRVSALKADIYLAADQSEFARWSLERVVETANEAGLHAVVASTYLRIAELEQQLGNQSAYKTALERATEADPQQSAAAFNLGLEYQQAGEYETAVQYFNQVLAADPTHLKAHISRAVVLEQLGETEQVLTATKDLQEFELDTSERRQVLGLYGRALYRTGSVSASYKVFSELKAAGSASANTYMWGGLALYSLERYSEAAQWFGDALAAEATDETRAYAAASHLAAGEYSSAEQLYRTLVTGAEQPVRAEYEYYLGWSLLQQERFNAAEEAWNSACAAEYDAACLAKESYL